LPLKNKTNKLFLLFICCRLGRSRIGKERKEKVTEKLIEKSKGKTLKKNPRKKNKKSERINL
jgi:hypothetical protein